MVFDWYLGVVHADRRRRRARAARAMALLAAEPQPQRLIAGGAPAVDTTPGQGGEFVKPVWLNARRRG